MSWERKRVPRADAGSASYTRAELSGDNASLCNGFMFTAAHHSPTGCYPPLSLARSVKREAWIRWIR